MTNPKDALWLLGACDATTQELTRRLAELPKAIAEAEAQGQAARELIEGEKRRIEDADRERRTKEGELQDCEAQRDKFQSQTALVKTNQEYSALLAEIDNMLRRIASTEEEILAAMEIVEQVSATFKDVEQEQSRRGEEFAARVAQLRVEMEQVGRDLETAAKEREDLLDQLGAEVKTRYTRISQRHGTGTARIHDQSCVACHRAVPPETVNRVLAGGLHACGSCARILVLEEA